MLSPPPRSALPTPCLRLITPRPTISREVMAEPSFRSFWLGALASNMAAAAQTVAVMWAISDLRLSPAVLLVAQVGAVLAGVAGIGVSLRLAHEGAEVSVTLAVALFAAILTSALGVVSYSSTGRLGGEQAYAVALLSAGLTLGGGLGAGAWSAVVAGWPGSRTASARLMQDTAQFQLGRFIGPLCAGPIIAAFTHSIQILCVADVATYLWLALLLTRLRGANATLASDGAKEEPRPDIPSLARVARSWQVGVLAVFAFSFDAARVYLPRYVREAGASSLIYSWTIAAIALTAAASAIAVSRRELTPRLIAAGLGAATLAMLAWVAAPTIGSGMWIGGGLIGGLAAGVTPTALTASLLASFAQRVRMRAASVAALAPTLSGAVGSAYVAATIGMIASTRTLIPLVSLTAVSSTYTFFHNDGISESLTGPLPQGGQRKSR